MNIQRLYNISQKQERIIIGLMSGTSLDGLDIAVCRCKESGTTTKVEILHFTTVAYTDDFKAEINSVFSKQQVSLEKLCILNEWIAIQHAAMINTCLQEWKLAAKDIDLIASHGQTIYHAPRSLHKQEQYPNATLQIGDGDHIAVHTGIITISDFRQKHIAAGGEGAPLAMYGDHLLFSDAKENRIMLNIGGIANFTYLPANSTIQELFSTDTGPGNTMMDTLARKYFNKPFDENADIAKQGNINHNLLKALQQHDFFKEGFPKTTGPELFNLSYLEAAQQASGTEGIPKEDSMATLNYFTATTIAGAISTSIQQQNFTIYTSGGGMHNPLLLAHLQTLLPHCTITTTHDLQILPDAKEAVLFAVLANECIAGNYQPITSFNKTPMVSMGKVSFPY